MRSRSRGMALDARKLEPPAIEGFVLLMANADIRLAAESELLMGIHVSTFARSSGPNPAGRCYSQESTRPVGVGTMVTGK